MTICCLPLWLADGFDAIEEGDFSAPLRSLEMTAERLTSECLIVSRLSVFTASVSTIGMYRDSSLHQE